MSQIPLALTVIILVYTPSALLPLVSFIVLPWQDPTMVKSSSLPALGLPCAVECGWKENKHADRIHLESDDS